MAIDFNKFSNTTNTKSSGVDFSKFGAKKISTPIIPTISPRQAAINDYMAKSRINIEKELEESGASLSAGTNLGKGKLASTFKGIGRAFEGAGVALVGGISKVAKFEKGLVTDKIQQVKDTVVKTGIMGSKAKQDLIAKQKSPEYQLQKALKEEKKAETVAKIATVPIRWTAGGLSTAAMSVSLEMADSNLKYTPKTDAEKLLIGDVDIQRLSKQEDLYGTIARGAGTPLALATMVLLENPFIAGTGINKAVKEIIEDGVKKQGAKYLSKLSSKEIINHIDELIKIEVKHGMDKKAADDFISGLKTIRIKELPVRDSQLALPAGKNTGIKEGEGFVMKGASSTDEIKLSKLQSKYSNSLQRYNKFPTEANLKTVRSNKEDLNTFKEEVKTAKSQEFITSIQDIKAIKPIANDGLEQTIKETPELTPKIEQKIEQKIEPTIKEDVAETPVLKDTEPISDVTTGGYKEAGLAKSIEAKALANDIKLSTEDIAGYTSRNIEEQAVRITDLRKNNIELARKMIRGELEIPDEISGAYLIKSMEDLALETGDAVLLKELAKSPLTGETSKYASELRMLREREKNSPLAIMEEINKSREKLSANLFISKKEWIDRKINKVKLKEAESIKKALVSKPVKKNEWLKFIDSIKC